MASRRSTIRCASCRATYWSDDAHRCPMAADATSAALVSLLWRSVADDSACTCQPGETCPECAAMLALGLGRWRGAKHASGVLPPPSRAKSKPRRWRKVGPHEYTLRMGPVTVEVSRYHTARDGAADRWEWKAVVRAIPRSLYITGRTYGVDGAPLAQCQADAIAAVERWRDGIR